MTGLGEKGGRSWAFRIGLRVNWIEAFGFSGFGNKKTRES